jgi:hypothetical protein
MNENDKAEQNLQINKMAHKIIPILHKAFKKEKPSLCYVGLIYALISFGSTIGLTDDEQKKYFIDAIDEI